MKLSESKIPLTKSTLEYIVEQGLSEFVESRDWKIQKNYIEMAKESYRFYRGIPIPKEAHLEYQSNYFKPMPFAAVETTLPRILSAIYATDPFFRYIDVLNDSTNAKKVDNLSKLVFYKMTYEVPFMLQLAKAIKNALIYGWNIIYSPWLVQSKRRYVYDKDGKRQEIRQNVIDAPWMRSIAIWDAYPQAGVDTIYEADFIWIREIVTKSTLLQRALRPGSPYIQEQVMKIVGGDTKEGYPSDENTYYDDLDAIVGLGASSDYTKTNKVELLHRWGVWDFNKDPKNHPEISDVETHIVMANRKQIVCAEYNPYDCQERPVDEIRPVPNTHGLLGIPLPQMGRDVVLEANDMMNLRLDNLKFSANKTVKIRRLSDIYDSLNRGNLIVYPGATIPVDQPEDVQEFAFSPIDSSLYVEDRILGEEYDNAMGIKDITRGGTDPNARTATGTSIIAKEANYRFDLIVKHILPSVQNILHKIGMYTQQLGLASGAKQINIPDMVYPSKKFNMNMTKDDIQGDFATLMLGNSTRGDKSYYFALLQNMRGLLVNDPNINIAKLDELLLQSAELPNVEELLIKIPPSTPRVGTSEGEGQGVGGTAGGMLGGGQTEKADLKTVLTNMAKNKQS